ASSITTLAALPTLSKRSKQRSVPRQSSRYHSTTPPQPCSSSSGTRKLKCAIVSPASARTPDCARRLTTRWVIPRSRWGTFPERLAITTIACPLRPWAPTLITYGRMRRSIASSPWTRLRNQSHLRVRPRGTRTRRAREVALPRCESSAMVGTNHSPTLARTAHSLMAQTGRQERTILQLVAGEPGTVEERTGQCAVREESLQTTASTMPLSASAMLSAAGFPRRIPPNLPPTTARIGDVMWICLPRIAAKLFVLARIGPLTVGITTLQVCAWNSPAWGQSPASLHVRIEVSPGPYYVGQGIELALTVTGREQRPKIELPRLSHTDVWIAGTSFQ